MVGGILDLFSTTFLPAQQPKVARAGKTPKALFQQCPGLVHRLSSHEVNYGGFDISVPYLQI